MKMAVIQANTRSDIDKNIEVARELMSRAVEYDGANWLLLPEHFQFAGGSVNQRRESAEILGDGPAYKMCAEFARQHGVYVHAGSIYEKVDGDPGFLTRLLPLARAARNWPGIARSIFRC